MTDDSRPDDRFGRIAPIHDKATSKMSTLSAILHQDPKPVSGIIPAIPAELERLINRCLRKDPQRRWQTMADLKVALDELKEDSDSERSQTLPPRVARFASVRFSIVAVALAAAIVLAVAGWYRLSRQPGSKLETPLNPVPLTTYPGTEGRPSFSPDGTQVAFAWCSSGNCDTYIKQIGVEPPVRMTKDPLPDVEPAWSPDGQTIAFMRRISDRRAGVMLIPQRGGQERLVVERDVVRQLPGTGPEPGVAWTPDSKWLVFPWRSA
jgi:eukaryotic-like serine/threonine-protein kinase